MVGINIQPGKVAVVEWLRGRFPIERDAVTTRIADPRPRQWRTVKISTLNLNPRDRELYDTAVRCAKSFIHDMAAQGFDLLTSEADMTVTGPYPHLTTDTGLNPDGTGRAVGRHLGQEQEEQYADFLIQGQFLRTRPLTFEYGD